MSIDTQDPRNILIEKIAFFRKELAIESDADAKFELTKRIQEAEGELRRMMSEAGQAYQLDTAPTDTVLSEKIKALELDEVMAEIHLVNCDRITVNDNMWNAFDRKEDQHYQFYFLCSCRKQMPPSSAERLIFELIHDELDEDMAAINYPRKPGTNRVDSTTLEFKNNLKRTQRKFNKQLAGRFEQVDKFDLEQFAKTGLPLMKESYVALVLTVDEGNWKDHSEKFFAWLMDTLSEPHESCPTFLFFFVIYLQDFCEKPLTPQQEQIIKQVDQLVARYQKACSMHTGLGPVKRQDLINWFDKLGETNVIRMEAVIEAFVLTQLKPEQQARYQQNETFDMADVEFLLQDVYNLKG